MKKPETPARTKPLKRMPPALKHRIAKLLRMLQQNRMARQPIQKKQTEQAQPPIKKKQMEQMRPNRKERRRMRQKQMPL